MKKVILSILVCFTGLNLLAQSNEFAMIKQVINTEKRVLITEGMQLDEEQAKVFWPIYDEYELERSKFSNRRFKILERYAKYYDNLSDELADKIMTDALTLRADELKLLKKYYKIFGKNLDIKTSARFIQLDEYLNTVIRLQVSDQIPFIPNK
jgi:hypothetical protein